MEGDHCLFAILVAMVLRVICRWLLSKAMLGRLISRKGMWPCSPCCFSIWMSVCLPAQIAFDGDGKPTKALQGYCSKNGLQPDQVTREADSKGTEYVWAEKQVPGKHTCEVRSGRHEDVFSALTSSPADLACSDDAPRCCSTLIVRVNHSNLVQLLCPDQSILPSRHCAAYQWGSAMSCPITTL